MKPGFLSGGGGAKGGSGSKNKAPPAAPAAPVTPQPAPTEQQPDAAAVSRPSTQQQSQPGLAEAQPAGDNSTATASWQQCMQLLKSDSEEKKFVGLLLVTKLLPQGTDAALQSVLEAVGWPFLQRMLLPLSSTNNKKQQQQPGADGDKLQQQQVSVSLGISILSALARLQQVAASEELLQLTPLLSRVAAAGGVAPVLLPQPPQQQQQGPGGVLAWADRAADAAAAVDALECLLSCASSGSYQCAVLLESNGLHTATAALAAARTAQGSNSPQQHAAAAAAARAAGVRAVMLSVQLLGVLLDRDAPRRIQLLQQHPAEAAAAVMLLAAVFGDSQALTTNGSSNSSTAPGQQHVDAAALQLQALHTLLLLLPLPDSAAQAHAALSAAAAALVAAADTPNPGAAAAATISAAAADTAPGAAPSSSSSALLVSAAAAAGDWLSALRRGLTSILRGRVGAVQRHSALQLAAAALELLGPAWLLPQHRQSPGGGSVPSATSSAAVGPDEFLLVLMEVLAIEMPLLLSDAMNPGAAVPRTDEAKAAAAAAAGSTAGDGQPAGDGGDDASSSRGDGSDADMDDADDAATGQGNDTTQPLSVQQLMEQQQQQQQQLRPQKPLRQQLAELQLADDKPVGQGQQQAGARALQVLPSCYQLLEGCLEVLVQQVTLMDDLADVTSHQPLADSGNVAAGGAGGAGAGDDVLVVGGRAVSWQEAVLPVLGLGQVAQLMDRMGQVTQVVCEFLEYATSPSAAASEAAAPVNTWLALGAVRLLGRFLADTPDAHRAAVQQLLPRLLKLQAGSSSGSTTTAASQQEQVDQGSGGGGGQLDVVSFLLPAMLSWSSKHTSSSSSHQEWVGLMLSPDSGCVAALAAYASAMATQAAAAAATTQGLDSSSSSVAADSEAQLGSACQVLYQLLSSRAAVLSARSSSSSSTALPALHKAHAAALSDVLHSVCTWSAARHKQLQQEATGSHGQPHVSQARAGLLALSGAGLQLPTLLPAAALAGQLLGLAEVKVTPETVAAAAELLTTASHAGICVHLLAAAAAAGAEQPRAAADACLQQLEVWEVAELEEVWDACLLSAAELLTHHGAASVFGRALGQAASRRQGWLQWLQDGAAGGDSEEVVEGSTGLQLLVQAVVGAKLLD